MRAYRVLFAVILAGAVASCGYSRDQRTLSGAGIGAATGAVGAAATGGSTLTGAVVGGAVGAIVGAFSDPDKIRLD